MIPLHDENPTVHRPYVTLALIAINLLVFLWEISGDGLDNHRRVFAYGTVPYNVTQDGEVVLRIQRSNHPLEPTRVGYVRVPGDDDQVRPGDVSQPIPPFLTLFTAMFLHGGWMHLVFNMWFLWIFGNNCEDAMGRPRFVVFYMLTGLIATGVHVATGVESPVPTIGASGAISGVLGAYLVLYPKAKVLSLVPLGYIMTTIRLPAIVFLGIWIFMQITNVLGASDQGVAWFAHIGGFAAGLAAVKLFETKEHRERGDLPPWTPPRFARGGSWRR